MTEVNYLDPAIYDSSKTGPQFQWLSDRLTLHGVPQTRWNQMLTERVRTWQLKNGYTGIGADGFVGPKQLLQLSMPPADTERISRTNWKITNPDGSEVTQPEFELYDNKPWFWEDENGDQVFRAPTSGGGTTPHTSYFRSENREMEDSGRRKAAWSSWEPRSFKAELAFTALPHVKQHAVGFQIHDAKDDVIMGRLEEKRLFIESPYVDDIVLTENYQLGTFFNIEIYPSKSGILIVYNGIEHMAANVTGSGWYYKYGCYCQAKAGQKWKGQTVPKDSFAETRFRGAVVLGG